jgi:2-keto-4-pentenoate hydratase/2-oxohepta-3-ene-1,7-dioic acid hydratase in catechol pathway
LSELKYQIGSGKISGKERIILRVQENHIDFLTLLCNGHLRESVSLQENIPVSLMHMLQHWSYWKEKLPYIVAYWGDSPANEKGQSQLKADEIHWLPPLTYPNKLICLGANYSDHNAEMANTKPPKFPYCFLKPPTTTLVGSGEIVKLPAYAKMIDWEVELAVVIGQKVHQVRGEEAMASIAGYSILNDISSRDFVTEEYRSFFGLDWIMLKGFDGSAPMGPLITPAEFVPDPQALAISLAVNGRVKQHSNTASMIFSVQSIIEHLATVLTLEPGDVIATGTPSGVGYGRKPQEFLRSGDRMLAEIEGLGELVTEMQ